MVSASDMIDPEKRRGALRGRHCVRDIRLLKIQVLGPRSSFPIMVAEFALVAAAGQATKWCALETTVAGFALKRLASVRTFVSDFFWPDPKQEPKN